jgi:predicted anti-sigma-YlaC factor YlaD
MAGHLSESELEGYCRRQLPVDELLAADEHLATCEACYARFRGDDKLEELYSFARADLNKVDKPALECISIERLTTFVNNQIEVEEREEIQKHLALCEECSELVSDLRSLRSEIDWNQTFVPAEDSPATARTAARFWTANRIRGAAAAAIMLVTLITAGLLQRQISDLRAQIGQLKQANSALEHEAASAGGLRDQVAQLEMEIEALRPDSATRQNIALNDAGRQVILDVQGNLSGLDSISPSHANLVKEALTSGRVRTAAASLPVTRPASVRSGGESETFKLRSPIGVAVLSQRPTFKWEPLSDAEQYVVYVRDLATDLELEGEATTGLEWTPQQSLTRGHAYSWVVEGVKDGRRIHAPGAQAPSATFKIVEKTRADELARVKASSEGSHLVMGILYARYGLVAEAESELRALRRENPESQIVARLIKSVRSRRPRNQ